jgi:hypothetical protein
MATAISKSLPVLRREYHSCYCNYYYYYRFYRFYYYCRCCCYNLVERGLILLHPELDLEPEEEGAFLKLTLVKLLASSFVLG